MYAKETVLKAITESGTIISTIAKKLGCSWGTARTYIQKWDETKKAYEDSEQQILDMCEGSIYTSIQSGDIQSAKWVLATKGKNRGWNEKIDLSGDISVTINDNIERI